MGCGNFSFDDEGFYIEAMIFSAVTNSNSSNLSQLNFTNIMDLDNLPLGITHDPQTRNIYVTVGPDPAGIVEASENGTQMRTIFQNENGPGEYFHVFFKTFFEISFVPTMKYITIAQGITILTYFLDKNGFRLQN